MNMASLPKIIHNKPPHDVALVSNGCAKGHWTGFLANADRDGMRRIVDDYEAIAPKTRVDKAVGLHAVTKDDSEDIAGSHGVSSRIQARCRQVSKKQPTSR